MERSKLVVGTKYAVSHNQELGMWAREMILLSTDLHTRNRTGEFMAARPGARAGSGDYSTRPVGLLMEDDKGNQAIVYPAHVKMTWTDYETYREQKKMAAERAAVALKLQVNHDRETAAELKALWPAEIPAPYFNEYSSRVEITKDKLIQLIKFLQK